MNLTEQELRRWLNLRAIEWANWPAFLSQPVVPILLVFFPLPYVLGGIVAADILWAAIRYLFVIPAILNLAALLVAWLKWPMALASAAYLFFVVHRYRVGSVALLWPLLAGLVCVPGQVGRIELMVAKGVGYVDQGAELGI